MQLLCFLAYVIQRAVFENRFQDCVFENFVPLTLLLYCKQSSLKFQITGLKSPKCVNMSRSSSYSVDYLFLNYWYWNHLSSGMKNMFVSTQNNECRWNTASEFVTSSCEMNIVRRAISLIKFIYMVIWHCANAISISKLMVITSKVYD